MLIQLRTHARRDRCNQEQLIVMVRMQLAKPVTVQHHNAAQQGATAETGNTITDSPTTLAERPETAAIYTAYYTVPVHAYTRALNTSTLLLPAPAIAFRLQVPSRPKLVYCFLHSPMKRRRD